MGLSANIYTKISHTICVSILQIPVVKRLMNILSFFLSVFCILQAYLFIHKFDLDYFIRYGPSYFITLFMLCCNICLPLFVDIVTLTMEEIESKDFTCTNVQVIKLNKEESIRTMSFIIITLLLALISCCSFVLPSTYDKDMLYNLHLLEEFFPKYNHIFTVLYKLSLLPLTVFTVMSPTLFLAYTISTTKCIVNILLDSIRNIDGHYEDVDDLNADAQNIIKERMRSCIFFHIWICSVANKILKQTQKYVLPFQVMGVLVLASIVIFLFTVERNVLEEWYFRIISLTASAFFVLGGITFYGQALEDMSTDIFDCLMTLSWYTWNVENKKLYLMWIINSTNQFKIKYSENISLNYKMGIELIKSFFTAMSIVKGLQKTKS